MLILTTNAFRPGIGPLPDWPGPLVLAVLPQADLDAAARRALPDDVIVLEWLDGPAGLPVVLNDAVRWLERRLREDTGPLLCLNAAPDPGQPLPDPERVDLHAVDSVLDADGRLTRLLLGEMVATSPLLPAFFRVLDGRALDDDAQFATLLGDAFAWGTA